MKRDLKKYLDERCLDLNLDSTLDNQCKILYNMMRINNPNEDFIKGVQAFWMSAQKQFLKDILDDIDSEIDKLFKGKARVKGDKAQAVAFESSIKEWLKNKYHYLKRRNRG